MPKKAGIVPRTSTLTLPRRRLRRGTKMDITNPKMKQVTSHLAARLSRGDPRLCVPASRPVCLFQLRTKWDMRERERFSVPYRISTSQNKPGQRKMERLRLGAWGGAAGD